MWNLLKMLFHAASAVHQCNFEYRIAKMFQRASHEFGVETIIGPPCGSMTYKGQVGLYYPNEEEQRRSHQEPLNSKINKRFYEFQRHPIRMWSRATNAASG